MNCIDDGTLRGYCIEFFDSFDIISMIQWDSSQVIENNFYHHFMCWNFFALAHLHDKCLSIAMMGECEDFPITDIDNSLTKSIATSASNNKKGWH